MKSVTVLGAGIAGISCAYHARLAGSGDVRILEAGLRPGGLLDHFEVEGFRFDHAIHMSFTSDSYVKGLFDAVPHYAHHPDIGCYEHPYWLKHPVQNNLYPLPVEDRVAMIKGFFFRPEETPANYREWLVHQYGEEIAERYPIRYTRKYWATHPEQLGLDWIGGRLRRASADEILRGAMTTDTGNGYYAQEMHYPKAGGYRTFIDPLLDDLEILYGKRVVGIDTAKRRITCADGSDYGYETLVSTLPLPALVEMLQQAPAAVREAARTLWATQVDILSVGIAKPDSVRNLWFYLYDEELLPSRGYSVGKKSPRNVPEGCSAVQFEIYSGRYRPLAMDSDQLRQHAVEVLEKLDVAHPSEVLFVDHRTLPYGNVVFDQGMEQRRELVRAYVEKAGVVLAGRFGEWEYYWSDQALLSGKRAAERLFGEARISGGTARGSRGR